MSQTSMEPLTDRLPFFEGSIDGSWASLLDTMRTDFGDSATDEIIDLQCFINRKQSEQSFGIVAPLILAEVLGIESHRAQKILKYWLAIYLYTVRLDDLIDEQNSRKPLSYLIDTRLLTMALQGLCSGNLPSTNEKFFSEINRAIAFQSFSTPGRTSSDKFSLDEVQLGKNRLLTALGSILGERQSIPATDVRQICEEMARAIQALDDISDMCEDYLSGIPTPLLSDLSGEKIESNRENLSKKVLQLVVSNGSLSAQLDYILSSLRVLNNFSRRNGTSNSGSGRYFSSLERAVSEVQDLIKSDADLDLIQRHLSRIYMSS